MINDPRERGLRAGLAGYDPKVCPYEKMTQEWREWQNWHRHGTELALDKARRERAKTWWGKLYNWWTDAY